MKYFLFFFSVLILAGCSTKPVKQLNKENKFSKSVKTLNEEHHLSKPESPQKNKLQIPSTKGFLVMSGKEDLISPIEGVKFVSIEPMFIGSGWQLTNQGQANLSNFSKAIHGDVFVLVSGHTDAAGKESYNEVLSVKRAQAVAKLMVKNGVSKKKLFYRGFGETKPISFDKGKAASVTNKRVEIELFQDKNAIAAYNKDKSNTGLGYAFYVMDRTYADQYFAPTQKTTKTKSKLKSSVMPFVKPKYDFGGVESANIENSLFQYIGYTPHDESIHLISKAQASVENFKKNCVSGGVGFVHTPVKDNNNIAYRLLNLNGRTWYSSSANGSRFAISGLGLQRDANWLVMPTVSLIKDKKTIYKDTPKKIDALMGQEGVMVRMVFKSDSPMNCIDIVFNKNRQHKTNLAKVYYRKGSGYFVRNFSLISIGN